MKVFSASGPKSFFFKDDLKALGFRWYREQKTWVLPETSETDDDPTLIATLNAMNGVTWEIKELPVEGLFKARAPRSAPSATVSSLERARQAAAAAASAPAPATNVAEKPSEEPRQDFDVVQLRAGIAAMKVALANMEQTLNKIEGRLTF